MRRHFTQRTKRALTPALVAALVLAIGTTIVASGNGPGDTYYACLTPGGTLNQVIVSPDETPTCNPNQTLISWNQIGPQGPQGEQGDTGEQGETGATGPQGPAGPEGPQGQQGSQGDTGNTGPPGPQGEIGDTGPAGISGYEIVTVSGSRDASGTNILGEATSPDGKDVLGGGFYVNSYIPSSLVEDTTVLRNGPRYFGPPTWWVAIRDPGSTPGISGMSIYAICAFVDD